MAINKAVRHHYVSNPVLPYISSASVIEERPHYVSGSNVVTSLSGYVARRPGFIAHTSDTFSSPVFRFFSWRQWNGPYFLMCNTVGGGQSIVYKQQIGTDLTFQPIFTSATVAPFDFVNSNNRVYFGNGTDMKKYDGVGVTNWGIDAAATPPTATPSAGSISANVGGYRWRVAFENSASGHIGLVSDFTSLTGNFVGRNYTISGSTTADPQVTHVRVYRTTDGGDEFFELPNSPAAYSGAWSLVDSFSDSQLLSQTASESDQNTAPPPSSGCVFFSGRIWTFAGDALFYSNFEEQINGVEEESFSAINVYNFGQQITALAVVQRALLVFTSSNVYRIRGDTLTTFVREPFLGRRGTYSMATIASGGTRVIAWLDTSGTILISDGVGVQDIGLPIRVDLETIDQASASCAFHSDGVRNWLIVQDSTKNKMWVYDQDNGIWMVPWSIGGYAIQSCETAAGRYSLMLGSSTRALKLDSTTFQDLGTSYTAEVVTNLMDLGSGKGPGEVGNIEYVGIERNAVSMTDCLYLLDEDPDAGGHISMLAAPAFSLEQDPPHRTQGEQLVEKWYFCRTGTARRASIKFFWQAASTEFRLYAFDMISRDFSDYT